MRSPSTRFMRAIGVAVALWSPPAEAQVLSRGPATYLEVAGTGGVVSIGPSSLVGGEPVADLIVRADEAGALDARPGPVKFSDIVVEVLPAEVTPVLRGWLDGSRPRVDGRLVVFDGHGRPVMQRGFSQALITEVTVPAFDARRLHPVFLKLRLAPTQTALQSPGGVPGQAQPSLPPTTFSLQLDGLDPGSVQGIEAFTIGAMEVKRDGVDKFARGFNGLAPSRLSVAITPAGAAQLTSWHDDFVLAANNGRTQERSLTLTLLGRDARPVLTLVGQGVGILSLRHAPKAEGPAAFQADLYVERWAIP